MPSPGSTTIVDLSGNGKGVALNVDALGTYHSIALPEREVTVIDEGRVVYDATLQKLFLGDGVTLGGNLIESA